MGASLVYYGVSYGSVDLGWNPYLTFALTGFIEFPANFTAIWVSGRYGPLRGRGDDTRGKAGSTGETISTTSVWGTAYIILALECGILWVPVFCSKKGINLYSGK
jgi:hypothetical protein